MIFRLPYFGSRTNLSVYMTVFEMIFFIITMLKLAEIAFVYFPFVEHAIISGSSEYELCHHDVTNDSVVTLLIAFK